MPGWRGDRPRHFKVGTFDFVDAYVKVKVFSLFRFSLIDDELGPHVTAACIIERTDIGDRLKPFVLCCDHNDYNVSRGCAGATLLVGTKQLGRYLSA
jgi:hypothetical protein